MVHVMLSVIVCMLSTNTNGERDGVVMSFMY